MDSLNKVKVENRNKRLIPLTQVTSPVKVRNYSMINRQRILAIKSCAIEASVDTKKTTSLCETQNCFNCSVG